MSFPYLNDSRESIIAHNKMVVEHNERLRYLNRLVSAMEGDIKLFHIAADERGDIERQVKEFCENEVPELAVYKVSDIKVYTEMKQPALVFGWAQETLPWRFRTDLAFTRDYKSSPGANVAVFKVELDKVNQPGRAVTLEEALQLIKDRLRN
jgi:hypothetical protein